MTYNVLSGLPIRTTTLNDRNFLMRALYKDMNYSQASSQH